MKLASKQVEQRVRIKLNKSIVSKGDNVNGIMSFGENNDYPQTIERLINGSKTAKALSRIYARFLTGFGFENEAINNVVIGRDARGKDVTIKRLLRNVAISRAYHAGSYVHCAITPERKIAAVKLIPFKYCRFNKIDDTGYASKIGVYSNWDKNPDQKYNIKNITFYPIFNLKENVFKSQIAACEGKTIEEKFKNFKGQIYFDFVDDQFLYPLSPFDSVYLDCDTEQQVSGFKNNMTRNGMLKKTILRLAEPSSDHEAQELIEEVEKWMGTDGASTLTLYDDFDPETGDVKPSGSFKVDSIDSNINDKLFESWEKSLTNDIRKPFNIPAILIDYEESKLGTTSGEAIIQATNFYNAITEDDRASLSEMFKEIFKHWKDPILSENKNWEIKKLNLYQTDEPTVQLRQSTAI